MKDIKIHIASSSIIKVVLILFAFYLLFELRSLLLLLVASIVIASSVEPAARWFGKYKIPRVPVVIGVYIASIAAFSAIFYFFIPPLFSQTVSFIQAVPHYLSQFDINFGAANTEYLGHLTESLSFSEALGQIQSYASSATGSFLQLITSIFGGVFGVLLVVVISFYLAVQEKGIEDFLRLITPIREQQYIVSLWERSQRKIGLWLQGQLLLGFIIGLLVFLGLTALGFPNPLFLAVLAGVFELIPIFGPILSAIPAILIGLTMSPAMGIITLVFYVVVQQFESNVIQPMVMKKVVGISPLISIISIIIGGTLAGFLGIILSIPIAAVVMEFLGDVSKEKESEAAEIRKGETSKEREVVAEHNQKPHKNKKR